MLSLSAVGAKIEEVGSGEGRVGVGSGKGVPPTAENFCIFYFKMVSFCACLRGFLFGIFYRSELCHMTSCMVLQILNK